jgi:hypothetical protein
MLWCNIKLIAKTRLKVDDGSLLVVPATVVLLVAVVVVVVVVVVVGQVALLREKVNRR